MTWFEDPVSKQWWNSDNIVTADITSSDGVNFYIQFSTTDGSSQTFSTVYASLSAAQSALATAVSGFTT
jgi:hypothetical protein